MSGFGKALSTVGLALGVAFILSASDQKAEAQQRGPANAQRMETRHRRSRGRNKSVTRFFVTSKGLGKGTGADAAVRSYSAAAASRWKRKRPRWGQRRVCGTKLNVFRMAAHRPCRR
jgi:hypothetical protein